MTDLDLEASNSLDLSAVKARHARLTDGDEYVGWHEWQRRVVDCAGDIPLLVAEVERLRAENEQLHIRVAVHPVELSATDEAREKYRVFANTVLDAAHAAGLIRYTDELEEVGRLSPEGEFWPSDAGYFYADEPVFVVRDRNTEAGT